MLIIWNDKRFRKVFISQTFRSLFNFFAKIHWMKRYIILQEDLNHLNICTCYRERQLSTRGFSVYFAMIKTNSSLQLLLAPLQSRDCWINLYEETSIKRLWNVSLLIITFTMLIEYLKTQQTFATMSKWRTWNRILVCNCIWFQSIVCILH